MIQGDGEVRYLFFCCKLCWRNHKKRNELVKPKINTSCGSKCYEVWRCCWFWWV